VSTQAWLRRKSSNGSSGSGDIIITNDLMNVFDVGAYYESSIAKKNKQWQQRRAGK
jgi:hypothetical protein